jgi:hypothetical protein
MTEIDPRLAEISFYDSDIRALGHRALFPRLRFRSFHICFLVGDPRDMLRHQVSMRELAMVFQFSERTVRRTLLRGPEDPVPLDRHAALDDDFKSRLAALLVQSFRVGKEMTTKDLLQTIRRDYGPNLTKG